MLLVVTLLVQILIIWAYFKFDMRDIIIIVPLISIFCIVSFCRAVHFLCKHFKSNWLLAISKDFIYITCHYLINNYEQVLCIKSSEITGFNLTKIKDIVGSGRTDKSICGVYVDIVIDGDLSIPKRILFDKYYHYDFNKPKNIFMVEASYYNFPMTMPHENTIRVNITGIKQKHRKQLFEEFRNMGIKKLEEFKFEFSFLNRLLKKDMLPEDTAKKRIIELLKEGRRLDARNAIQYYYLITRKQTNEMIENLVQEYVLK